MIFSVSFDRQSHLAGQTFSIDKKLADRQQAQRRLQGVRREPLSPARKCSGPSSGETF